MTNDREADAKPVFGSCVLGHILTGFTGKRTIMRNRTRLNVTAILTRNQPVHAGWTRKATVNHFSCFLRCNTIHKRGTRDS